MQLINISPQKNSLLENLESPKQMKMQPHLMENPDDSYEENRELLMKNYPGKLLYSIKETASVIGVSYEFIRQKTLSGEIITRNFGDRKLIHINELTNLITKGIN